MKHGKLVLIWMFIWPMCIYETSQYDSQLPRMAWEEVVNCTVTNSISIDKPVEWPPSANETGTRQTNEFSKR